MAPTRRDALARARILLAPLLCVAGVLAALFLGAPALLGADTGPTAALDCAAAASIARTAALGRTQAQGAFEKGAVARPDGTLRLQGDTPDGRAPDSAGRASGSSSRAARHHERPLDTAALPVTCWTPASAGLRLSTAGGPVRFSTRRGGEQTASVPRDPNAPRGPPSNLTA